MGEEKDGIVLEKRPPAGWVILSRPRRMNALSPHSLRALWRALGELEADPEIRALVITGAGEAFCAGMEMSGLEGSDPLAARRRCRELQAVVGRVADSPLPVIAAVNGVAMGAGLELCLACDLALASPRARFGFPEARLGMIPCGGGTQRLVRLVGLRRAEELVLTGRILSAREAAEWGLINGVTGEDALEREADELARRLASCGKLALYQAKRCLRRAPDLPLERGLEHEAECFATCFASGEPAASLRRYAAQAGAEGGGNAPLEAAPEAEGGRGAAVGRKEGEREAGEGDTIFE
ncbi:MAG: enoyl-CoA hydratase/isomerase family protein [Actinobacteria bacterium]|nr:enoyl-CoA hydratase/isomerase family protein [Actinomycetota bacterium]